MQKNLIILLADLLGSCTATVDVNNEVPPAKNIILFIGDGMGVSQVSASHFFKDGKVNFDRFNRIGLIKTYSSTHKITDSAAGATAFSIGKKSYNGAIGVDSDSVPHSTILEILSRKGFATGLIATSSITHATPACFYAHEFDRDLAEEIASDFVQSDVDFMAGGGIKYFNKREDGRNLLNELKAKGFSLDTTGLSGLSEIQNYDKAAFLLAANSMPCYSEGRGDFLPEATELGIQFLTKDDDNQNFFMMVEGSQVDWGGHANDGEYLVSELIDFDDAIGIALDFAEQDGNTLVVVTADHETGGFTLAPTIKKREDGNEYSDYNELSFNFSTNGHSAALIPVFAYGPGSEEFIGVYENTDIFEKILKTTKWRKEN